MKQMTKQITGLELKIKDIAKLMKLMQTTNDAQDYEIKTLKNNFQELNSYIDNSSKFVWEFYIIEINRRAYFDVRKHK